MHDEALTAAMVPRVVIVGGGPAGLMAAEVIAAAGYVVDMYDAMPSVGRKFLLAGIGGLNLTHSEEFADFVARYGARRTQVESWLQAFGPAQVRAWAQGLGIETFVGSSGRVFPREMKAAPLLRAWLRRLRSAGVRFHVRHRWLGWATDGALRFATPQGEISVPADALVLGLGGGSWPRFGSDAAWLPILAAHGVDSAPLRPANCGFDVSWRAPFVERYAGQPLKAVVLSFTDQLGQAHSQLGECMVTRHGLEGSLIYAHAAALRDMIEAQGAVTVTLDLFPGREQAQLTKALARPRGSRSQANHLRRAGIEGVKAGLLREAAGATALDDAARVSALCKALPVTLSAPRPLAEAISSAGGVRFEDLDEQLMLRALPGVFCAGEMLDWEAPTGGYLLTACLASGRVAGAGVVRWLKSCLPQSS